MSKIKLLLAVACLLLPGASWSAPPAPDGEAVGLIVKFRAVSTGLQKHAVSKADAAALSQSAAVPLVSYRAMSGHKHVLRFTTRLSVVQAEAAAARLALNPEVEFAVPDRKKFPHRVPNDELFAFQWNYTDSVAGINLPAAWDLNTGSASIVVAIADTGSRPHPDAAQAWPGYDFISDAFAANDGDGRDADPTDTGDGVSAADLQTHPDLVQAPSSWHGESVAGLVAAASNNGFGVAGVNWNAHLLHVRVLGKGGGTDSDILDGINWAAGLAVPGVPDNPHPAQIINMSLGGDGPCGPAYQDTFDALIAAGKVIVVSAGNNSADVANTSPANCNGVITVAATSRNGSHASYSNVAAAPGAITLAAPGGDGAVTDRILTLSNTGSSTPLNESYVWKQGTSFAAPQVAGVAALMLTANPTLTPAQLKQILRDTARPFASGTSDDCNAPRCGAGILDAHAAVLFATQMAAPALVPATGWWWSPGNPGVGFSIEQRAGRMLVASYLYDVTGRSTWYASGPGAANGATYLGTLMSYAGGQTLTGAYRAASVTGNAGDLALSFSSPTQGMLSWPGGSMAIARYDFGAGGAAGTPPVGTPEAGWWWAPAEGGRGYAIEIQGNTLFIAGYMYDPLGNPVWYSSGPAAMSNLTHYQGQWQQYGNGTTLAGPSRTAQLINANAGALALQFSSVSSAILTLPDGRQIAIERYRF